MYQILHVSTVHIRYDTRIFIKQASSCAELYEHVGLLVADNRGDEMENNVSIISSKLFVKKWRHLVNPIIALILILFSKKYKSKIYHFHDPELIIVAAFLGLLIGKNRIIIDVHESTHEAILNKQYIPKLFRKTISAAWNLIELFVVKYFIHNVVAATPYIQKRFSDISNSILVSNYPKIDDVRYVEKSKSYSTYNICYIGNINSMRGLFEFLKIWKEIDEGGTFYVIGKFSDYNYERRCKEMNLNNVKYLGHLSRQEIAAIVSRCSIGILPFLKGPNHDNAIPNKFFEYMAYGLHVISNELPLLKKMSEELKIPITVDITNVEASAKVLKHELLGEPHLKGQKLADLVWSNYNWNIERDKLIALYNTLIGKR